MLDDCVADAAEHLAHTGQSAAADNDQVIVVLFGKPQQDIRRPLTVQSVKGDVLCAVLELFLQIGTDLVVAGLDSGVDGFGTCPEQGHFIDKGHIYLCQWVEGRSVEGVFKGFDRKVRAVICDE